RRDARTGGHFIDDLCDDIARPCSAISPSGATHCWIATAVALRRCLSRLRLERRVTTFPKLPPLTSRDPQAAQHRYTSPLQPRPLCLPALSASDCDCRTYNRPTALGRRGSKPASMLAAPRRWPRLEDRDHPSSPRSLLPCEFAQLPTHSSASAEAGRTQ